MMYYRYPMEIIQASNVTVSPVAAVGFAIVEQIPPQNANDFTRITQFSFPERFWVADK